MEVKVYSGHSEVINSGVAFVRHGEEIEFLIANLKFHLVFEKDEKEKTFVNYQIKDNGNEKLMTIKCYNFKDALLNRMNNPLTLAYFDNKELTLQFSVSTLNKRTEGEEEIEDMMVMYSWCLKDISKSK